MTTHLGKGHLLLTKSTHLFVIKQLMFVDRVASHNWPGQSNGLRLTKDFASKTEKLGRAAFANTAGPANGFNEIAVRHQASKVLLV